jgi:NTP pyrophosphatase (non-canonical NTP hydrolase)
MTYEQLQAEQAEWAAKRFGSERGATAALAPLAGVVEELGELSRALVVRKANAVEDAIGDVVIYLCDVCTRMGWQMPETPLRGGRLDLDVIGRLSHSVLKSSQGIRQAEDHKGEGLAAVRELLGGLDQLANGWHIGDAIDCATFVWENEVSKRDVGHAAIPQQ